MLIAEDYPSTGEIENFGDFDIDENGNVVLFASRGANNIGNTDFSDLCSGILTVASDPNPDTYFFADTDED